MTSIEPKAKDDRSDDEDKRRGKSANSAPDAVKDPNEKTEGKPGLPPGADQGDDADPGGG